MSSVDTMDMDMESRMTFSMDMCRSACMHTVQGRLAYLRVCIYSFVWNSHNV